MKNRTDRWVWGLATAMAAFSPAALHASWAAISLDEVVKSKPVVVIGEIKRIETAAMSETGHDIAFIKIESILKSPATSDLKLGAEIPLAMPSVNRTVQVSTDVRFPAGQRGVWILEFREGKYWAARPDQFQAIDQGSRIVEVIKRQQGDR